MNYQPLFGFLNSFRRFDKFPMNNYLRFTLLIFFLAASVVLAPEAVAKPSSEELCYMSATDLLQLFKSQEISPVDVLKAQIERIELLDPTIKAVSEKHFEEAMAQARESETRYKQGNPRALEGLTCAMKDDIDVKGWRSTMGSLILKDAPVAEEDSALTTILKDSGLVMHMQTNVPEFYCNLVTWNYLYGVCRNPWNTAYTPGGSSGGAAAALSSGFTTLAIGSDMGGSIRFPAAMSGLYGFKPPYGRVSTSLIQYESMGPLARSFEDLNLFQNVMAGPSPTMISALRPKLEYPEQYGDIKGWRIAYDPMDHWGVPVDDTVIKAMNQAVEILRSLGAEVEQVDLGFRAKDFEIYALGLFSTSIGPYCFSGPEEYPELVTPYMAYIFERYSKVISPKYLVEAENWIYAHSNEIQKNIFSQGFKAVVMPTMCTPYVVADLGSKPENNFVVINGNAHTVSTWAYSFTWPWNMLGQYPVMNVPIGLTAENIPLGMQIIGNIYDDLTAFQIASEWSKAAPKFYQGKHMPPLNAPR